MSDSATITREQLRTVLIATELGGRAGDSSHFSYAQLGSSSSSFGQMQFDVDANPAARTFLTDNGFDAADITTLRRHGQLSNKDQASLDAKLQAIPQDKLDQFTNQQLDNAISRVSGIIDSNRVQNSVAADTIVNDATLQLGIADYANQFSSRHDNQLAGFLAGSPERGISAGSPPTREDVQSFIGSTPYGQDLANARGIAGREKQFNKAMEELGLGSATHGHQHPTDFTAHPGSLRQGDRGEAVGIVQQELRDLGYTDAKGRPLTVNKDFGASTAAAIKAFQSEHALTSDGIVGKDTANALTEQVDALQKNQGPNALNAPNASDAIRDPSVRNAFEAIAAATERGAMDGTSTPTISGANRLPNADSKPMPDPAAQTPVPSHAPSDPRHPENPQHAKYEKLREQITAAYGKHGFSLPPEQLERVTASVMLDAQKRHVKDIKEVHLNPTPGTREVHANSQVLAFSGDPKDVTTFKSITDVQQARQTAPEQSYQQLSQLQQQQTPMQAQVQTNTHTQPATTGGAGMGR